MEITKQQRMCRYELEKYEITALTEAVLDYLVDFSHKVPNFEVNEDSWFEFTAMAVAQDQIKYRNMGIEEHIIPAMPENPYGMLGLVNYISQFYLDNYKLPMKTWFSEGPNSIFLKVVVVFSYNITFEDFSERMAKWVKEDTDEEED